METPVHPALQAGTVAVVTGAASGIGRAAARHFASLGLKVCMADLDAEALSKATGESTPPISSSPKPSTSPTRAPSIDWRIRWPRSSDRSRS